MKIEPKVYLMKRPPIEVDPDPGPMSIGVSPWPVYCHNTQGIMGMRCPRSRETDLNQWEKTLHM